MPEPYIRTDREPCLAVIVGNTRVHWAWLTMTGPQATWHTSHLTPAAVALLCGQQFSPAAWTVVMEQPLAAGGSGCGFPAIAPTTTHPVPLMLASVVPPQTALWQSYPALQEIQLQDLPLQHTYPTLGIDRALNLLGAGDRYGWPSLVIDAGTALTFTAGTMGRFVGGAILPGLATQFQSLQSQTANLPPVAIADSLPERWAKATPAAMQSGIQYGVLATIGDFVATWRKQHEDTQVVITGGDAERLHPWLLATMPDLHLERDLTFWGLWHYWCAHP